MVAHRNEKQDEKDVKTETWLTLSDQKVVVAICLLLILWASWRAASLSHWGSQEIEIRRQASLETVYLVDVNEANWLEFAMLEGVGEVLAKKIVAYREEHGDFVALEDLRQVNGIGKKTFEKFCDHLVLRQSPEK